MIRVRIAHDDRLLREALALALAGQPDIRVVESTPEGDAGLERFDDASVDVLVLCVPWRERPFEEVTRYRRASPTTRIVGLYSLKTVRNQMLAAGIDAVVDQADGLGPLIEAIRRVAPL